MNGKTVIITGGNRGIGRATAIELARHGAKLVLGCRSIDSAESVLDEIRNIGNATPAVCHKLDLSEQSSIRQFANTVLSTEKRIDVLINNAGVMPLSPQLSDDGFELTIGTNHLGHFLLTLLLSERIIESAPARIIHLSSVAHWLGKIDFDSFTNLQKFSWMKSYSQAKLANLLFSNELARRLKGTGVTSNALHPGVVGTDIVRSMPTILQSIVRAAALTPERGARTSIRLASDPSLALQSGGYYSSNKVVSSCKSSKDEVLAKHLWDRSLKLTQLVGKVNLFAVDE